jgi:glycosyltransferase involved in cell wall biosynthesis
MSNPTFSILITTKNRIADLQFTLIKIKYLLVRGDVECIVYDDGSTDNTSKFIKENYPNIILLKNPFSKGLIYCRNQMLNQTTALYAISLDDDAHLESENILQNIENHFKTYPKCGVIACRIYWGLELPLEKFSNENSIRTKGFIGCGHVWNMQAWYEIPNYPEWFGFYGEEDFAAFQLFKNDWEIHYLPEVLIHHRVDVKSRKKQADYQVRLRRSLRSGWYLYFLFYPIKQIPRRFFYTLWIQIKNKAMKGDTKATIAIIQALLDVIIHVPKLIKQSNRLTMKEFREFQELSNSIIYWHPTKS